MFLRAHHRWKDGKDHRYFSLVETVRTAAFMLLGIAPAIWLVSDNTTAGWASLIGLIASGNSAGWSIGGHLVRNYFLAVASAAFAAGSGLVWRHWGGSLGRWMAPRAMHGISPVPRMLLGFSLVAALAFGIASTGLAYAGFTGSLMLAAIGLALAGFRFRGSPRPVASGASDFLAAGLGLVVFLPRLLLPETHGDSLVYHLLVPEQVLVRHRFPEPPVHEAWSYVLFADMANIFPLSLGLEQAVKMTGALLALAACVQLIRTLTSVSPAWSALAAAAALVIPGHLWAIGTAKNDGVALAFLLAVMGTMCSAGPPGDGRRLIVAGLLGAAAAAKPVLIPFALTLAIWSGAVSPRRSLAMNLAALAGLGAWLLPWIAKLLLHQLDPAGSYGTLGSAGSWTGVLHPPTVALRECGGIIGRDAPLIVIWIAAAVSLRITRGMTLVLTLVGTILLMTLAWPGGHVHLDRYCFPAAAVLNLLGMSALPAAWRAMRGTAELRKGRKSSGWGRGMLIVPAAAVTLVMAMRGSIWRSWDDPHWHEKDWQYLTGRIDAAEYRKRLLGSYGELLPHLEPLTSGGGSGRLLAVGGKFLTGIGVPIVCANQPPDVIRNAAGGGDGRVAVRMRQAGIGWILFDPDESSWLRSKPGHRDWSRRELERYAAYARRHFTTHAVVACRAPGYGMQYLIKVTRRPAQARDWLDVLPGVDAAFGPAFRAGTAGRRMEQFERLMELRNTLPRVAAIEAAMGDFLYQRNAFRDALPLLRDAATHGYASCMDPAWFDWALASLKLGNVDDALEIYRRAQEIHTEWPKPTIPILDQIREERAQAVAGRKPRAR